MSVKQCDSGHSSSSGNSTACMHCNNLGLVNGNVIVSYSQALNRPEVKKYICKYCGHTQNIVQPYNLVITQAQWTAYEAM